MSGAPRAIWVFASPGEWRVALAEGDTPIDYAVWRPGAPEGVGDIHAGRVTALAPAMAGCFLALDGIAQGGFLPDSAGGKDRRQGDYLAVRITRAAQGGKGPRLEAVEMALDQPGLRLVARGPDPVRRFAAACPDAVIHASGHAEAAALRADLGPRLAPVGAHAPEGLLAALEALEGPRVALAGGLSMTITPTPALVAVDMDMGAAGAGRGNKQAGQMAANRVLITALAAQIRLRNLSGAILVDFAGLPMRKRAGLTPVLAEALAPDRLGARLMGFSNLGLAEILRPRVFAPLHEVLAGPHAAGLAALRALAAEVASRPALVPALRAAPAVVSALEADAAALDAFAQAAGRRPALHADPALAPTGWRLEEA